MTWSYAKRCLTTYLRDRTSVFYSLLAPLILLALYIGFLGKMQVDSIIEAIPQADPADARAATFAWVAAALLMVTCMTAPIMVAGQMVSDRVNRRLDDFLVSPLRAGALIGGEALAAFIYSMMVVAILGLICCLGLVGLGAELPSFGGWLKLLAGICLSAGVFAALSVLLGTLLPSDGAVGGAGAAFSSIAGFLAGVYVPVGVLGSEMTSLVFVLPFGQSAYLIREALALPSMRQLADRPEVLDELKRVYGFDLMIGGQARPGWIAWAGLLLFGLICAVWAVARIRRRFTRPGEVKASDAP
ncbi:MAG: ABC transporter permease [Bifidobacteriaceae bacterium]|jgi:multidrug/hemolysin transport system permease protein|nr:ABC transporter permease [Bifidobacteriaceae bacterium]